jgi:hypothetical protein
MRDSGLADSLKDAPTLTIIPHVDFLVRFFIISLILRYIVFNITFRCKNNCLYKTYL